MYPTNMNFGRGGWLLYFALSAVVLFLCSVVAFCSFVEKAAAGWLFLASLVLGGVAIAISFTKDKGKQ